MAYPGRGSPRGNLNVSGLLKKIMDQESYLYYHAYEDLNAATLELPSPKPEENRT